MPPSAWTVPPPSGNLSHSRWTCVLWYLPSFLEHYTSSLQHKKRGTDEMGRSRPRCRGKTNRTSWHTRTLPSFTSIRTGISATRLLRLFVIAGKLSYLLGSPMRFFRLWRGLAKPSHHILCVSVTYPSKTRTGKTDPEQWRLEPLRPHHHKEYSVVKFLSGPYSTVLLKAQKL